MGMPLYAGHLSRHGTPLRARNRHYCRMMTEAITALAHGYYRIEAAPGASEPILRCAVPSTILRPLAKHCVTIARYLATHGKAKEILMKAANYTAADLNNGFVVAIEIVAKAGEEDIVARA